MALLTAISSRCLGVRFSVAPSSMTLKSVDSVGTSAVRDSREQRDGLIVQARTVLDRIGPGAQCELHRLKRLAVDGDRASPAMRLGDCRRNLLLAERRHPPVRVATPSTPLAPSLMLSTPFLICRRTALRIASGPSTQTPNPLDVLHWPGSVSMRPLVDR